MVSARRIRYRISQFWRTLRAPCWPVDLEYAAARLTPELLTLFRRMSRAEQQHGIALCQGNFTLMTDDLPAAIRHFGKQGKIFFVHFRDVRGTPEKFVETFHDDGQTDMLACMEAYRDIGFDGVCRPDHVPTMEGDSNEHPAYSSIGRLFAVGYLKGLREAVYRQR